MTTEKIYSIILDAMGKLTGEDKDAIDCYNSLCKAENMTAENVRNTSIYSQTAGTALFALKLELEEEIRKEAAKKSGRKNFAAVKRYMKKVEKDIRSKPALSVAHENDGKYWCTDGRSFYVSGNPDGLTFAPEGRVKEYSVSADNYWKIISDFYIDKKEIKYEIPYTVAQIKAWKKNSKDKPFSLGHELKLKVRGEIAYAGINADYLITAMEITGSNILYTDGNCHLAMFSDNGDMFGIMTVLGKSPVFQQI